MVTHKVEIRLESVVRLFRHPAFGMLANEQLTNLIVGEDHQCKRNGTQPP